MDCNPSVSIQLIPIQSRVNSFKLFLSGQRIDIPIALSAHEWNSSASPPASRITRELGSGTPDIAVANFDLPSCVKRSAFYNSGLGSVQKSCGTLVRSLMKGDLELKLRKT